jgi:hypothetical protein
MIVRFKGKEFNSFRLIDQYTIAIYDSKNKKRTVSTWDVEIYVDQLGEFQPFEAVYGQYITSDEKMDLRNKEPT